MTKISLKQLNGETLIYTVPLVLINDKDSLKIDFQKN